MPESISTKQIMINTPCAICGRITETSQIYPAQFYGEIINEESFSARRFYNQKIHFQVVSCLKCGLWRSDPIIDPEQICRLYQGSKFTYGIHTKNLEKTYGHYLKKASKYISKSERLLDIGCGNCFFMAEAKRQGFKDVWGVEPSIEAIEQASDLIKPFIKLGVFSANLFPSDYFDVITIFQALEHFVEPGKVIEDCLSLLKPGGVVLVINHNISSWPVRFLGESSPVIDIEHLYFFNGQTMKLIFESNGFLVKKVFRVFNRHTLGYLASLLPIQPIWLKDYFIKFLKLVKIEQKSLILPIGNVGLIAQKPK